MPERTKNDILTAFNALIETKGFDKITVQMIIDEAGIGRATFYRYFKDKYDVMNYNYMKFIEEYLLIGKAQTFEDFFYIMTSTGTEFFRN
ncbi:MAG: TetR/AcrR family transcriptional regulator, partial [Clostridia bacterium]|nr:TetR/AcrR family transcriptional regulator [Clostridia bacterium]MBR6511984.1 TetR/AcrR family transcriptional regulator [Clostridia bacterium]